MKILVVLILVVIGYLAIDYYNHCYIPTFTDEMNKIICIEEGIE